MASVLLPAQPGLGKTSWAQSTRPTGQRLAVRRPWQPTGPGWRNIGLDQASRGRAASPATCALGPWGTSWGWGQQGGQGGRHPPQLCPPGAQFPGRGSRETEDSRSSLDKGIGFPLLRWGEEPRDQGVSGNIRAGLPPLRGAPPRVCLCCLCGQMLSLARARHTQSAGVWVPRSGPHSSMDAAGDRLPLGRGASELCSAPAPSTPQGTGAKPQQPQR